MCDNNNVILVIYEQHCLDCWFDTSSELWRPWLTLTTGTESKYLHPVTSLLVTENEWVNSPLWSHTHRDKYCGGGRLKKPQPNFWEVTCSKNGQNLKEALGSIWTHTWSQSLFSHIRVLEICLRRNRRITSHSVTHILNHTSHSPTFRPLFSLLCWMFSPFSSPWRIPWKCHSAIL